VLARPTSLSLALCGLSAALALAGCSGDAAAPDGGRPAHDAGAARIDGAAADAGLPPPGEWTVIVLPDTQILAQDHPEIFEAQTRWIAEQRDALDIRFVLHVGDVVNLNDGPQWDVADRALRTLEEGGVPYVIAPGNHDYGENGSAGDRDTLLSTYFPVERFSDAPSFGGVFEEGRIDDSFHVFETPAGSVLVVALEFGPRDEVVAWADEVIRAHAPMRTFVVTHAFLYSDDTRYDRATRPDQMWSPYDYGLAGLPGGVNDGEEMWQAFIRQNDPIDLVLSGHVLNDGIGRLTSTQDEGGVVHQLLANYQHQPLGGAGFLRILTFSEDGSRVDVRTYSPWLDEDRADPDDTFSLSW